MRWPGKRPASPLSQRSVMTRDCEMTMLNTNEQAVGNGTATHYKARHCLLCRSPNLFLALPLAHSAIGNDYFPTAQPQQEFALNLHLCRECGNAQVEDVVNP